MWVRDAVLSVPIGSGEEYSCDFTSKHVVALIGEPDLKVKVEWISISLTDKERACPGTTDKIMESLYGHYSVNTYKNSDAKEWRSARTFLESELWLYNWRQPLLVSYNGIFGAYSLCSNYFIIQDGTVVDAGEIDVSDLSSSRSHAP